jgi:O-antigen ligase
VWSKGIEPFLRLDPGAIWRHFKGETFAFKMICIYLVFEYVRPQSIMPQFDIIPWSQTFIILSAIGLLVEKKKVLTSDPATKWMLLFFVAILICSYTAYFPEYSWNRLINFYSWLIIYFLIINIVNTRERLIIFLIIFFLASFKLSLFGAKTWAMRGFSFTSWGMMGPPGFFQNSGELAIQMIIFTFLSYQFIQIIKNWISRNLYIALLLLLPMTGFMTIMASSSRGGQLAFLIAAAFYFKSKINFTNLTAAVLVGVLFWNLMPEEQMQRFEQMGEDESSQQRLLYWENGIEMWKENKWAGVGYYNFQPYFEKNYPEDILSYKGAELPHNIFIQILTDLGLVGMIPYLFLIKNTFLKHRKRNEGTMTHEFANGFNAAIIGFYIAGQFVSVVYYPFMWIHLAFVVCIRNISSRYSSPAVA